MDTRSVETGFFGTAICKCVTHSLRCRIFVISRPRTDRVRCHVRTRASLSCLRGCSVMWVRGDFEQGDEMSYRSGLQMFAIMTNWKTEFHRPLTRPGDEHLLFEPSSSQGVYKFQLAGKWPENEWISCKCGKLWWECVEFVELIWTKQLLKTWQPLALFTNRWCKTKELIWPTRTTNIGWETSVLISA